MLDPILLGFMSTAPLNEQKLVRAARHLAKSDQHLAYILESFGPPPLWTRRPGFPTLVQIILEQQVSLASAASMFARLKKNIAPFHPVRVIELGEAHLKSLGLTRQKTAYCLDLAQSLTDKRLNLSKLTRMSDAEAKEVLMKVKGLGSWSADIYLLMALRRADIWPTNDLALAVAITKLKELKRKPTADELSRFGEAWRPFRSVAARMLWQYYLARRNE